MWDGRYIALGDQEATGKLEASVIAATLSGTTLSLKGTTILGDDCGGNYRPAVNAFIVGKKKTPANRRTWRNRRRGSSLHGVVGGDRAVALPKGWRPV